ncbi:MAG: hypothetical protein ABIP11_03595 [Luteimonas sp.]
MALTLGFTGMDSATEAELTAAFQQANARLRTPWRLMPETEAQHVIVDMDSMYGPMSWLRLHAAGKQVIGLTTASRTQADFHLSRPFDSDSVLNLLKSIAPDAGVELQTAPRGKAKTSNIAESSGGEQTNPVPSGMSPSPAPQDLLPKEHPLPVDEEAKAPSPAPGLPKSVKAGTLAPSTIIPAEPAPAPVAAPAISTGPTPATRGRTLADWLEPGLLRGRLRFRPAHDQLVLIDAEARQYFATTALKPLATMVDGVVTRDDFIPVDATSWAREVAALGAAQPLNRLQWYGGLLAGKGALLSEYDPAARFKLSKWPQTEREFPKHFRIATAMMKGPATLEEITAASGVPTADVIDFVNASLVSGFAEFVPETPAEPMESNKPAGLFGRLRGK